MNSLPTPRNADATNDAGLIGDPDDATTHAPLPHVYPSASATSMGSQAATQATAATKPVNAAKARQTARTDHRPGALRRWTSFLGRSSQGLAGWLRQMERPRFMLALFVLVAAITPMLGVSELVARANRQAVFEADISQSVLSLQQVTAQLRLLAQGQGVESQILTGAAQRFGSASRRLLDQPPAHTVPSQEEWQSALTHLREGRESMLRFVEQATEHRNVLSELPRLVQSVRSNAEQLARQGESLIALALNTRQSTPEQLLSISQVPNLALNVARQSELLLSDAYASEDALGRIRKDVNTLSVMVRGLLNGNAQIQINSITAEDVRAALRRAADLVTALQSDLAGFDRNLSAFQRLRDQQRQLDNHSQLVLDALSRISTLQNTAPWWKQINLLVLGLSASITLLAALCALWQWRQLSQMARTQAHNDFVSSVISAVESLSRQPAPEADPADSTAGVEGKATNPPYAILDKAQLAELNRATEEVQAQLQRVMQDSRMLHMHTVNLLLQGGLPLDERAHMAARLIERQAQTLNLHVDNVQTSMQTFSRIMQQADLQTATSPAGTSASATSLAPTAH